MAINRSLSLQALQIFSPCDQRHDVAFTLILGFFLRSVRP